MENAATTLISNAGQLLGAEYRHLSGVGDEITELRDELDIMNALLRMQAEAEEGATDHFVRVAMKQLRELAYDAEDRIDLYLLHIKCRPGDGVRARFKHLLATLFARRRLAGELSALRARAVAISERHARYGVNRDALRRSRAPMLMASAPAQALRFANSDAGHRQFIGMEDQVENLANRLKAEVDGEKRLKVFSIVGFGGVGKTTLAVEVCRRLEQEFPFQAMVSVSQAFEPSRDLEPLLKRVLDQVVKVKAADERGIMEEGSLGNVDGLDSLQLAEELKKRLENKRYLIVIDDVWTTRAWEAIQSVLPENNCNSRIIVTTRMETLAKACSPASIGADLIHHMQPLKHEESKKLFLSRVFGSVTDTCPGRLKEVMENILKKCGGLPLAIISIAGILVGSTSSGSLEKWKMICKSIGSQMESNPTLEGMRQIVTLSFNHLPHELKDCMMYLSIFPEDYLIGKNRLLMRWIAEGLVPEKRGLTRAEIAESYLDELLCRNMIQVDRTYPGRLQPYYRVHDMFLEVMVSMSLEANFVSLQGGPYEGLSYARLRRLSIHSTLNSAEDSAPNIAGKAEEVINVQHVRSLSIFQRSGHKLLDQLGKFTLLRVLDLEGCQGVTNKHVRDACQLHLLKFLSLRGTNISMLPRQVGNLQHLQTLDLLATLLEGIPDTVTKLERLEVLLVSNWGKMMDAVWKLPRGISKMKALRRVYKSRLGNDVQVARELGKLEKLQEIDIYIGPETICEEVVHEIELSLSKRHYSLRLLWIRAMGTENKMVLNFVHRLQKPPRLLRSLGIDGETDGLPTWIGSLTYLVHFTLIRKEVVSDQLFSALCGLPNLRDLRVSSECYSDDEIVARTSHKFPALSYLYLKFSDGLPKVIRFEEGSMEKLENFEFIIRRETSDISITGIEYLTNLKTIKLTGGKDNPALTLAQEQLKAANDRRPEPNKFQVAVMYRD